MKNLSIVKKVEEEIEYQETRRNNQKIRRGRKEDTAMTSMLMTSMLMIRRTAARLIATFMLLLAVIVVTGAQEKPKAATPTVDQILEKYVSALGGKAAIEKLTSRAAKGTFEMPAQSVSANMEAFVKAPNKSAFAIDIPGFGLFKQSFNGSKGWISNPASGLREMAASEVEATKRDDDLHQPIKFKQFYPKIELKGTVKVGDRDTYLVEATPAGGSVEKFYFDTQTGLLARSDNERETPDGKISSEVLYEDYRDVDGVKVPHTTRHNTSALSFVLKLTEVKQNVPIEDAKFEKPAQ